jgi:tubulin alpha
MPLKDAFSSPNIRCPTEFKIGINSEPPQISNDDDLAPFQRSLLAISNTTAIAETLSRVGTNYDKMLAKGAFIHWYTGEGLDKSEFAAAREDLTALQSDYRDAGVVTEPTKSK